MAEQMSTDSLELYCRNRARAVGPLNEYDQGLLLDVSDRLCNLQADNTAKDAEIAHLKEIHANWMMEEMACQKALQADLARVTGERDAFRPSVEVLEAIDELVEFVRPIMSIGTWLGFVNVIGEWRGSKEAN